MWANLANKETFKSWGSKGMSLKNPALRIFHKILSYNLFGKKDRKNSVSQTELYILWAMENKKRLNFSSSTAAHFKNILPLERRSSHNSWQYHLLMSLALFLITNPLPSFLFLKIYLRPITLWFSGRLTNSLTSFHRNSLNSSCMALIQLISFRASRTSFGSSWERKQLNIANSDMSSWFKSAAKLHVELCVLTRSAGSPKMLAGGDFRSIYDIFWFLLEMGLHHHLRNWYVEYQSESDGGETH